MPKTRYTLAALLVAGSLSAPAIAQQSFYDTPVPSTPDNQDPALTPVPGAAPQGNTQLPPELQPLPSAQSYQTEGAVVDDETLARAERQLNGNFESIDRIPGLPLGATQDAWSQPLDHMSSGQSAPGVVRFKWTPELVMPIRMRETMITTIALPEWEQADEVLIGEGTFFEALHVRDNAIALRVGAAGVDTNITVYGSSGNVYTFYARAETFNTRELTDLTVFVDAAPASDKGWFRSHSTNTSRAAAAASAGTTVSPAAGGSRRSDTGTIPGEPETFAPEFDSTATIAGADYYVPREQLRFAHKMYEVHEGDREIAPEIVYTNGRWTFFHYGSKAATVDRPVVYRVVDGVETRVNTRTIGSHNEVLVAEAVGDFVLRGGQKVVCVKRFQGPVDE